MLRRVKGSSAFWPPLARISSRIASSALSTLRLRFRSLINEIDDNVDERDRLLSSSALSSNSANSFVSRSVSSSSPLLNFEHSN